MDEMFVVLVDGGLLKSFEYRIWYDKKKAEEYYKYLYAGSDVKWTILKVGDSVAEYVGDVLVGEDPKNDPRCSRVLAEAGLAYPRSCPVHGLFGKCE